MTGVYGYSALQKGILVSVEKSKRMQGHKEKMNNDQTDH